MTPPGEGLPGLAVRRPMMAAVLNLLIVIAGLAAILGVEVRELPDVDRPIVSVRATLPGAAPETIDAEVTSILEGAVATVSGVKEIQSSSEENSSRMRIEFNPGIDLDTAASDVREAVSRVTRELPDRVENLFVTKADDRGQSVLTIAVISDAYSEEELSRIVENDIMPEFLAIDGVATVQQFGTRERQMRVLVDPLRLNRFGLTIADVADALRQAPFDVPVGSFRSESQELIVRAEATAATPALIKDIYIEGNTKIGDVAEAVLGPADAENFLRLNGEPIIGLGIIRQASSNTIQISEAAKEKLRQLNRRLDDVELRVTSDEAVFIEKSVEEVLTSLAITVLIVVITIWIFLGSLKATIIPAVAIPVSLIGTIAGIWMLGFSINLLTLLALVLATGLIVDDAIVVLENIQRRQSEGIRRRAAAVLGTQQVFFAVIATTAVLVAVFVPISFLPSTTGRLFREFGFVLSVAVLTLAPAIASRFRFIPRDPADRKDSWLEKRGRTLSNAYGSALGVCLSHPIIVGLVCLGAAGASGLLYTSIAKELVPSEDRGVVEVFATGPDGVGLAFMDQEADEIEQILQPYVENGTIESLFTIVGRYDPNRVGITAWLAPWEERTKGQEDIITELQGPMSEIPGSRVSVFGRSSLSSRGGGRGGGLQVALTGSDYSDIYVAARELSNAIEDSEILSNPEISYQPTQPQLSVQVDRRRAADLNIPLDELSVTLRAMVDGEDLIDLNVDDQSIPIILESETGTIRDPGDLRNLYVRSRTGDLVPISTLTTIREEGVAAELDRTEQRRAIEVEMDTAPDLPLADAIAEIERLTDDILPSGISMVLQGEAATLEESNQDLLLTYGFAFVIVFLVLVAQFESITSPIVVLLSVPFALAAAVFALFLTGTSLNIYSQIGLIMLIGLMAKNGILLVEFADQLRGMGRSVRDAVYEAATIRLRPIAMTLISTVLGSVPLIISSGAGAESRNSIGWVVFGGLGLAALFTLFLTPVIYLGVAQFSKARTVETRALEEELDEARENQSNQPAE
ncbi:efflux RND transporter permease subunit [Henriciella marina]|uniref:efflux RND transporter permease subunit n=1 Tax=Henriciella marina TaxID=453851 RepID=UPI000477E3CD|nr:efflux RND transporter permease subunit [Henriciella marina]